MELDFLASDTIAVTGLSGNTIGSGLQGTYEASGPPGNYGSISEAVHTGPDRLGCGAWGRNVHMTIPA